MIENYQEAADRMSFGLPVHIDHPDSRVWLRWGDKTLQPFRSDNITRGEWGVIAARNTSETAHLIND